MTVKELKEKLSEFDENLEVGGSDDKGYLEPIFSVTLQTINYEKPFHFVGIELIEGWRESND